MPNHDSAGSGHETSIHADLSAALTSSLDIDETMKSAYPILCRLVGTDCGALGISSTGRAEDYRWVAADLPPAFFAAYPEMAPHDFVRKSVIVAVNRVLRDDQMLSRVELEKSSMYRHARAVGVPLQHVMAVMLHVDERWQAGLSLYRTSKRPFSAAESNLLQLVTRALANTVRNCHRFGELAAATQSEMLLESVLIATGAALMVVAPPHREVWRSKDVTALLERWFPPHERVGSRLPEPLATALSRVAARPLAEADTWSAARGGDTLDVAFARVPGTGGHAHWMLLFHERHALPASVQAKLTPREREITGGIIDGKSNQEMTRAGGSIETVKKHVSNVFNKLGVDSRAQLVALVAEIARRDARLRL